MVIDDKTDSTSAIDDPIEKSDRIDDEIASVATAEVMATDEEEKVAKEVAMVRCVFTLNDLSVNSLFRNKRQHRNRRNQPRVLHEEPQARRNQRSVSSVVRVQLPGTYPFDIRQL